MNTPFPHSSNTFCSLLPNEIVSTRIWKPHTRPSRVSKQNWRLWLEVGIGVDRLTCWFRTHGPASKVVGHYFSSFLLSFPLPFFYHLKYFFNEAGLGR